MQSLSKFKQFKLKNAALDILFVLVTIIDTVIRNSLVFVFVLMYLPCGAMGWLAIYYFGINWSYINAFSFPCGTMYKYKS